jgi:hypothetical protein
MNFHVDCVEDIQHAVRRRDSKDILMLSSTEVRSTVVSVKWRMLDLE